MNKRKLLSMILAGMMVASALAGCSNGKTEFVEKPTTTASEVTAQTETIEAVEAKQEIVSFTDKDKDGNTITLSPIYDNDGTTIIAGYILSAKDSKGAPLTAEQYKLLNSVVKAARKDNTGLVIKNGTGDLIPLQTYSDMQGNIIAMVDSLDLDGDKDVTELLKIEKKMDGNGISKVMASYTTVKLKTEKGKTYIIDGDKKTEVKTVDSKNTEVAKKEQTEVKKNEAKKETAEKKESTTKAGQSTTKAGQTTTKDDDDEIDEEQIILKKNQQAEAGSSNVTMSKGLVTITGKADEEYDYVITSDTDVWHGQIVVKMPNTSKCSIRFENVNISYNKGNVIQLIDTSINSDRTFLEKEITSTDDALDNELQNVSENDNAPNISLSFPEGTSSSFVSEAKSYTGIMYNESKLTIKGNGKVKFESKINSENCICSTKSITVKNVDMTLLTAQNTNTSALAPGTGSAKGIFSYSKVKVESGHLTVKANGDGIRCNRFICEDGTVYVSSSACDAFDTDNEISILGGNVKAYATEKSIFKVRRINAGKTLKENDTFRITGGTVYGEGKKATKLQSKTSQDTVVCQVLSTTPDIKTYGTRGIITVKSGDKKLVSTTNKCTTVLYSSSSVSKDKAYTMSANGKTAGISFEKSVGSASVKA